MIEVTAQNGEKNTYIINIKYEIEDKLSTVNKNDKNDKNDKNIMKTKNILKMIDKKFIIIVSIITTIMILIIIIYIIISKFKDKRIDNLLDEIDRE